MTEKYTEDKRLLGALDYIDEKFIAEVTESYKIFEPSDGKITARRTLKISLRQFAALAACLILLSAAFPVTNYVVKAIKNFAAGWGSEITDNTTDVNNFLETDPVTENKEHIIKNDHIESAPYFIFSNDLEPISVEKMDEVRNAWYQIIYNYSNSHYCYELAQSPIYANDKEKLEKQSSQLAKAEADEYKDMMFSDTLIDHFRCRYYATLNGYVIFAFNTYLESEYNSMVVGNVTFLNPTSFYIFAYGNGEILTLEEAYKNNWLSASDISIIGERHNAFNNAWTEEEQYDYLLFIPDLEPIADEKIKEIRDAIYENYYMDSFQRNLSALHSDMYQYSDREEKEIAAKAANSSGSYYSELFFNKYEEVLQYHHRYYGILNDCVVLLTYGGGEDFPVTVEIAEYTFLFPSNYKFEAFVNGEFITIFQAYEMGLLNKSDIKKLHERHLLFEESYKNYKQDLNESIIGGMNQ